MAFFSGYEDSDIHLLGQRDHAAFGRHLPDRDEDRDEPVVHSDTPSIFVNGPLTGFGFRVSDFNDFTIRHFRLP